MAFRSSEWEISVSVFIIKIFKGERSAEAISISNFSVNFANIAYINFDARYLLWAWQNFCFGFNIIEPNLCIFSLKFWLWSSLFVSIMVSLWISYSTHRMVNILEGTKLTSILLLFFIANVLEPSFDFNLCLCVICFQFQWPKKPFECF